MGKNVLGESLGNPLKVSVHGFWKQAKMSVIYLIYLKVLIYNVKMFSFRPLFFARVKEPHAVAKNSLGILQWKLGFKIV